MTGDPRPKVNSAGVGKERRFGFGREIANSRQAIVRVERTFLPDLGNRPK